MPFLFESKYKYTFHSPAQEIHAELKALTNTPLFDISTNLTGTIFEDGSFIFEPKFSFFSGGFYSASNLTVMTGQLKEAGDRSMIYAVFRPSYTSLFIFYALAVVLLFQLYFSLTTSSGYSIMLFIILLFVLIIQANVFEYSKRRLRKRFEKSMLIKSRE